MQIAGLDVGTQNIKLLVVDIGKKGEFKLLKILSTPSRGLKKGAIYDMDAAVGAMSDMFGILRKNFRAASKNIFVNVNGPQISARMSKGVQVVSRADNEIYKDDIERVIKNSQAIGISPNRRIVHTITKEFIVDGVKDIIDPVGLVGNRLEVESVIIDAFAPYLQNLTRLIEINGGRIGGFILSPLASSRAILTREQKELGVVMLDIGASTTGMTVYEDGKFLHSSILPVGASHITSDVAIGFKVPIQEAEQIKLNYGHAIAREVQPRESVDVRLVSASIKNPISRRYLSEVIEARLAEIFEFVNNELKGLGKAGQLPGGVVLAGGGAKLPGILEMARDELRLSSRVGLSDANFEITDPDYGAQLEDPEYVCATGLVLCGAEYGGRESMLDFGNWGSPAASFIKSFLKNLLP